MNPVIARLFSDFYFIGNCVCSNTGGYGNYKWNFIIFFDCSEIIVTEMTAYHCFKFFDLNDGK